MSIAETSIQLQLDELCLIKSSLLPHEHLTFLEDETIWNDLMEEHTTSGATSKKAESPARFRIDVESSEVYFVVEFPNDYEGKLTAIASPTFSVKGDNLTRNDHDRWQSIVKDQLELIGESEFPVYQLLILHLLPIVHEKVNSQLSSSHDSDYAGSPARLTQSIYHALLTSHHLISPNKRRSLQNWSASLSISGFAKVGYPGVIYATGQKDDIEEFVGNIKAMQWLALKVRFVEELPGDNDSESEAIDTAGKDCRWKEFQKVGEVVDEMRRLGRERYVVEMGVGSVQR